MSPCGGLSVLRVAAILRNEKAAGLVECDRARGGNKRFGGDEFDSQLGIAEFERFQCIIRWELRAPPKEQSEPKES
jgi:hypothetical protein